MPLPETFQFRFIYAYFVLLRKKLEDKNWIFVKVRTIHIIYKDCIEKDRILSGILTWILFKMVNFMFCDPCGPTNRFLLDLNQ